MSLFKTHHQNLFKLEQKEFLSLCRRNNFFLQSESDFAECASQIGNDDGKKRNIAHHAFHVGETMSYNESTVLSSRRSSVPSMRRERKRKRKIGFCLEGNDDKNRQKREKRKRKEKEQRQKERTSRPTGLEIGILRWKESRED